MPYVSLWFSILPVSPLTLFEDEIRPEAAEMVHQMQQKNFQVVMLTGDHKEVAEDVCSSLLAFLPMTLFSCP